MGRRAPRVLALLLGLVSIGAGLAFAFRTKAPPSPPPSLDLRLASEVVKSYDRLMHAMWTDVHRRAVDLESAVARFLADPTQDGLEACRAAWKKARPSYLQTEVGRFYEGPGDMVERFVNGWPLDEAYLDSVAGRPDAGIINDPKGFPVFDETSLREANEKGGETNIATGWHAIEFLLWGQDLVPGPGGGRRSYRDYLPSGGTAPHPLRRAAYLRACAALLVKDLNLVRERWAPETPYNYPSWLEARPPGPSVGLILSGVATLAFGELRGERLVVPFTTKDKEDEHSCFSDTTHLDHLNDMIGIRNIWEGRYVSSDGTSDYSGLGLRDLARSVDRPLADRIDAAIGACVEALRDPALDPFEIAVQGDDAAPGRRAVQKAIDLLADLSRSFVLLASRLDVRISSTLKK